MVTSISVASARQPTVPFIGLAEAMFLSALRRAGVPMQQVRPALAMVEDPVLSRVRAGEQISEVADDFDLPEDQVTEVADRAGLMAA